MAARPLSASRQCMHQCPGHTPLLSCRCGVFLQVSEQRGNGLMRPRTRPCLSARHGSHYKLSTVLSCLASQSFLGS